jgi:hypothetical protein
MKREGSAKLDHFHASALPVKLVLRTRQTLRPPLVVRRTSIKNEHHYELLFSYPQVFTADVSVFQAHLPCDL